MVLSHAAPLKGGLTMGWAAGIVIAALLVVVLLYYAEYGLPPGIEPEPTPASVKDFLVGAPTATPSPATPTATAVPQSTASRPPPTPTPRPRVPTPTAAPSGAASGQNWSGRWVEFTVEPHVCGGTLEFTGQAIDGARVEYRSGSISPFSLYEEAGLRPGIGYVGASANAIAGYIAPAPAGSSYGRLPRDQIIADILSTTSREFRLRGDFPSWLPDPEDAVLGVWGQHPERGQDLLRLIEIEDCRGQKSPH